MFFIYEFAIRLFKIGMHLAALFHPKARLWVQGRQNWRVKMLKLFHKPSDLVLWVHAASLGEFEQGRPLIEAFRAEHPDWKILLTFFSPSGYEMRKHYEGADWVAYLPADTHANARDFLDIVQPDLAIFIKYEFWANHLLELKKRGIPTLLISAIFRPSQPFFQFYGAFWRKMLTAFAHIFVQEHASEILLQSIGIENVSTVGDTRVDRVLAIAQAAPKNPVAAKFVGAAAQVLVVGSSWEPDENLLAKVLEMPAFTFRTILAPHEPSAANVARAKGLFPQPILYSEASAGHLSEAHTLIIDNIGLLNTLYQYGTLAYIGGGFGKGIHNTLEPAAFGLPILFGPKYAKFEEARQLVATGGAFCVRTETDLQQVLTQLQNPAEYKRASQAVRTYLEDNRGATRKIMDYLDEHI